jgi:hypothetical protein
VNLFEIVEIMVDENKWPTYRNSRELTKLHAIADEAYNRDSFDGYLSYIMITHQCCEDFVLILIQQSQLTLHICLLQHGFGWRFHKSHTKKELEGQMSGKLIDILENSLEFKGKSEFVSAFKAQNSIRNRLAHRLVEGLTVEELRALANEYESTCRTLVDWFNDADEAFYCFFQETLGTKVLDGLVLRKIEDTTDAEEREKWQGLLNDLEKH